MLAALLGPALELGASSPFQMNPESPNPTPAISPAAKRHGEATIRHNVTAAIKCWRVFGLKLLWGPRLFLALHGSIFRLLCHWQVQSRAL